MSELNELLAARLAEWLARRPQLTLNALSRITGVPYPTLTRVKSLEGGVSEKTVIALIPHLFSPEEQPKIYALIGVKSGPSANRKVIGEFEKPRIQDKTDFAIIAMLARKSGVSSAAVQSAFGAAGRSRLEYFYDQGMAKKIGDAFFVDEEHIFFAEKSDAFKQIGHALELMDSQAAENMIYLYMTGGLTEVGLEKLHQATKAYHALADEIFRNHQGDLLGVMTGFSSKISLEGDVT